MIVSFTCKAVNNIKRALPDELKPHALTIHKVLEFQPVFYEEPDINKPGSYKKTMRLSLNVTLLIRYLAAFPWLFMKKVAWKV